MSFWSGKLDYCACQNTASAFHWIQSRAFPPFFCQNIDYSNENPFFISLLPLWVTFRAAPSVEWQTALPKMPATESGDQTCFGSIPLDGASNYSIILEYDSSRLVNNWLEQIFVLYWIRCCDDRKFWVFRSLRRCSSKQSDERKKIFSAKNYWKF